MFEVQIWDSVILYKSMFLSVLCSITTVLWLPMKRVLLFNMPKLNFKASRRVNKGTCLSQPKGRGGSWRYQKMLRSFPCLCISVSVSLSVSWRWSPVSYSMSRPFKAFNDTFYSATRNYEILKRPFATSRPWRKLVLETLWDSYFWWSCLFLQSMKMFLSLIKEYEQWFFRTAFW